MTEKRWAGFHLPIDTDHRNKAWTQQVAWFISALLLCIIVNEVRKMQLMTRVCGAWSLKNNTWRPLVLTKPQQPSPEHKNPWPVTGKMWFGAATRNAARATQKRSAGLHIRLRDLRLAARIIWRRPAHSCCLSPKRVLHLTAWPTVEPPTRLSMSLPAGSRGVLVCLQCQNAVRKFPDSRYYWPFFSSEASTFPSLLCVAGRRRTRAKHTLRCRSR